MARQIMTRIYCDVCLQEGTETEAEETPPIVIGTAKPRLIALCELHGKELFAPFRETLMHLGQIIPASIASPASTTAGAFPCPDPECPKHTAPYAHMQGLHSHARSRHGMTLNELRTAHGIEAVGSSVLSEARRNEHLTEKKVECPECAAAGTPKVFKFPAYKQPTRALGVHRAKAHGVPGAKSSAHKP